MLGKVCLYLQKKGSAWEVTFKYKGEIRSVFLGGTLEA
jgi:hypothetical protein